VSDDQLVNQILSGQTELFESVVRQYQGLLYSIAFSVLRDVGEAENITQEAFLYAYLSLSKYEGRGFKAWLCRIATNKAIDQKRRQAKARDYITELPADETCTGSFAELIEDGEDGAKLRELLAQLPQRYSYALELKYSRGCKISQIAQMTGQSPKTVESQLYRAKQMLKKKWGERDEEALHGG